MATYETEEEQIEALKKWWKENGLSVIGGIVIGLGLIAGWRWWQVYSDQQAQIASNIYNQVVFSLEKEEIPQARQAASQLLSEYSGSPYAILAALNMAHHDLEKGDIDSSQARLQWVIENSKIVELAHVARLRKARLFLSQKKVAETKKLIEGIDEATFRGEYAEIRGDIAMAEGRIDDARNAYTEAVGHLDLSPQHLKWVQMKLDDLGLKKEKRIEASAPTFPAVVPPPVTESPLVIEQPSPTVSTETSSVPEPVAPVVESEETPVTTKSEPVAPVVETEETPVTTEESEPVAPVVETEETAVTTKSEPVAPVVETEETPVTTESEPVAPVVESEETPVTTKSEPVAPVVETEETPVTTESEPVAAPVETEETVAPVVETEETVAPVESEETVTPVETEETTPAPE